MALMTKEEIIKKVMDGFEELDVTFSPIDEIEFYLLMSLEQKLRIDPKHLDAVARTLETDDIDDFFDQLCYKKPDYDETGAIVYLPLGYSSDIWPFDALEKIGAFLDPDFHIIAQDDLDTFYKIWVEDGKIRYGEGKPGNPFIKERHSLLAIVAADEEENG